MKNILGEILIKISKVERKRNKNDENTKV